MLPHFKCWEVVYPFSTYNIKIVSLYNSSCVGAVIIFTGLLSTAFLGRLLKAREWLGMLTVIMGLRVVVESDFIFGSGSSNNSINSIITGDLLIVMAQIVTASQMVWEEKFVTKHNVPALQAVGWEGIFGFVTLSLLLIPMYFLRVGPPFSSNPRMVLEDALDGFIQMRNNPMIILAMSGICFLFTRFQPSRNSMPCF